MLYTVIAVGKARAGPERALFDAYAKRLRPPIALVEVEDKRGHAGQESRAREASLIEARLPAGAALIALDEGGELLDSAGLARRLGQWRDTGRGAVAVAIGGADGLDASLRARADLVLALGRLTWPHLMVRGMIAEQLYRAETILAGHPYHRG